MPEKEIVKTMTNVRDDRIASFSAMSPCGRFIALDVVSGRQASLQVWSVSGRE